ncbi:MAG: ATP-binding domain-containing protein, partial [Oscillibacter sp.]|nr:ATP-binding domain-containing protein [Oscillibacter sp.]
GGSLALPEFYDAVCEQTGYTQALKDKNDMESRGRLENVQELKSNILGFLDRQPEDATLSGFLNEIALYTDLDSLEGSDDCVTLMTIHAAKGLEFPLVYVVGMEEGVFPGSSAQYEEDELEEERRLCYVAMTRAKERLTLTHARQRMLYGKTASNRVSRFLEEAPEENLNWEGRDLRPGGTFGSSYGSGFYGGGEGSEGVRRPVYARPARPSYQEARRTAVSQTAAPFIALSKGDRIEHGVFGKGTVLSVQPMGGDALVQVDFEGAGQKKLMLKAAAKHLKKLDS